MSDPNAGNPSPSLQFDQAVDAGAQPQDAQDGQPAPIITCSNCQAQIKTYYYNVDDNAVCAKCKQEIARTTGAQMGGKAWVNALLLGFGAAIVGAAIYYGVIAITGWQIGIVAFFIGLLVGAAVRKGAAGGGGRRYQILAVGLTYFSVGLAYSPLVFKEFMDGKDKKASAVVADTSSAADDEDADSVAADSAFADADSSEAEPRVQLAGASGGTGGAKQIGALGILVAIGATFLFIFALPIMVVVGSLPGGIISALIIGYGMRTAWRMTEGHVISITGPYKVGGQSQPAPATA
jgi:hypothetical protein